MHEPLFVGEAEPARDLDAELEGGCHREGAAALHQLLEVLSVDELEDDELPVAMLAAVDHGDDVRMRKGGDGARLAPETLDVAVIARVLLVQHLQRDGASEQAVVRPVDARHASGADELLELVAVGQSLTHHHGEPTPET